MKYAFSGIIYNIIYKDTLYYMSYLKKLHKALNIQNLGSLFPWWSLVIKLRVEWVKTGIMFIIGS